MEIGTRSQLQSKLEALLGSKNVYFQPPESCKMQYPAIVYSLNDIDLDKASNKIYNINKSYSVTLIHKNPDNTLKDLILNEFEYIRFNRFYTADNLNHYNYTIFF